MSEPGATRQHPPTVQELHHLAVHEAVLLLESDPERGLDDSEAAARRERFGPNVLPPCAAKGPLVRLALQFHHPLIYILVAAAR